MEDGLTFDHPPERPGLEETSVFLSTSIPDPSRWSGEADPLEITDAVVAFARTFLTAGVRIVNAAHPTISPLLLYVAAELPAELGARVAIFQSQLFDGVLPTAIARFQEAGIGTVTMTEAVEGERPEPGHWNGSLALMRERMLSSTEPDAAVFLGGMGGILEEYEMFRELRPEQPTYALSRPGGAAREIAADAEPRLPPGLLESGVYPTIWSAVLDDLEATLPGPATESSGGF